MIENLIVALIVGACAWYAGRKYLPAGWIGRKKAAGCGSGCDTCDSCESTSAKSKYPVIKLVQRP